MTAMVRCFLTDRRMFFKAKDQKSSGRHLRGGAPQGTLLGNFLFIITTDELELKKRGEDDSIGSMETSTSDERNVASLADTSQKNHYTPLLNPLTISTPTSRGQFVPFSPAVSDEDSDNSSTFEYFKDCQVRPLQIDDTDSSSDTLMNTQINEQQQRPSNWKHLPHSALKYVDDFIGIEKLFQGNGHFILSERKRALKIHATQSEDFFVTVKSAAEEIWMTVNEKKTQMLCITAAVNSMVTT